MRQGLFCVVGMLTLLASVTTVAQNPSPLDTPTALRLPAALPACGLSTAIAALARTSSVAIGFEEESECLGTWPRLHIAYDKSGVSNISVRDVLDRLVALFPNYRWSDMNGVAVVRPAASWTDPTDARNLRVEPFHLDAAT